jgi:toxin YhaV
MIVNGWALLCHEAIIGQLTKLAEEYDRACKADPNGFTSRANVKLFAALSQLMLETIPNDPTRPEYRQGNTLGPAYRHWFRTKFFGRFRLFFRYSSRHKIIVYAWVNDENTLRKSGSKSDPYAVFEKMLASGYPSNNWDSLVKSCVPLPKEIIAPVRRQRK